MNIPERIAKLIGDRPYTVNTIGMSGSQVICFDDMVLKIEPWWAETENNLKMLQWLPGKLSAPEVICSETVHGVNYLLMTRLRGRMSCSPEFLEDTPRLVSLLAQGPKQLWAVDITGCPCDQRLDAKLRLARYRVENHLYDLDNVEPETFGEGGFASPEALLKWLEDNRPGEEEPVLSHGDYCLPNVFLENERVSGFLDLGRSGVCDKYQDIALCYRSLRDNLNGSYGGKVYGTHPPELLFEALQMEPDWEKIRYYLLLDELF